MATRDIKAMELILIDAAIAHGPPNMTTPGWLGFIIINNNIIVVVLLSVPGVRPESGRELPVRTVQHAHV